MRTLRISHKSAVVVINVAIAADQAFQISVAAAGQFVEFTFG